MADVRDSRQMTAGEAETYLVQAMERLPMVWRQLCWVVIADGRFRSVPGSSGHHHACVGGLMIHTAEVLRNVLEMTAGQASPQLISAAIWHDYAKIHEYAWGPDGTIRKLDYRVLIGHVVGSCLLLDRAVGHGHLSEAERDAMLHIMLAHHGRLEWRSPVEPQTGEAWVLHAADMLSARPGIAKAGE